MPIRTYKPTSPGRRGMSVSTFDEITRTKPERSLLEKKTSTAGRNNQGRMTSRHRGGGVKRRYRVIDFKRDKFGVPAKVFSIEYDPNRSARIALLHYLDGAKRYILAPQGLKVGDMVMSGPEAEIRVGNAMPLRNVPTGSVIHNIELRAGRGGQIVRSAGVAAQLMAKEGDYARRAPALRRAAPDSSGLHGDARPGGQPGAREHQDRQGWTLALPGPPPARARLGDEPGGSSTWRWRGSRAARWTAADALGQARAWLSHAPQQAH